MMKKIISIFILSFFLNSCIDLLDKFPLDVVTEKTYWTSTTDLRLYLNQFYPVFKGRSNYAFLDDGSDNNMPIEVDRRLNGTRSMPATGGGWSWTNVRRINYFLENMSKVTDGIQTEINHFKGEGYFFRAYFYFSLVKQFGDIPWFDEVLTTDSEQLYAKREPRNIIVDHIVNDLEKAILLLQSKNIFGENRISREAAILFKSRVCLYEGTWEKYHKGTVFGVTGTNGQSYLEMATEAAGELIKSGKFSLFSTGNPEEDYYKLFSQDDLKGISEAIMYDSVDPSLLLGNMTWTSLNGELGGATGITKSMIDSYLAIDGLPISLSNKYLGDTTLTQVIQNRDPRLKQSIWIPGMIQINFDSPLIFQYPALFKAAAGMATTGYMVRKGSTTDPNQNVGASNSNYGDVDAFIFRYAEALLNYAEAKAELGTLTQEDLDISINLLRQRVGMPKLYVQVEFNDPDWEFPNLSPIINEIRRERRVELAFEGFRFDDLMRWRATNVIKGHRPKGARFILGKSFPEIENQIKDILVDENRYIDRYQNVLPNGYQFNEERDFLSPIPINQMTLNPNLDQNPGW